MSRAAGVSLLPRLYKTSTPRTTAACPRSPDPILPPLPGSSHGNHSKVLASISFPLSASQVPGTSLCGLPGETCLLCLGVSEYNKPTPLGQPCLWLYDSPLLTKAQTRAHVVQQVLLPTEPALCSFSVPCFMIPLLPWGYFL